MQPRKRVIILLVAAVLTATGLLIFKSSQRPPSPQLPSPNGYDDFVKAGQMLTESVDGHRDLSDYREMSVEELRQLVTQNAEALRLARKGLSRECRVPIVDSQTEMGNHLTELGSIKQLTYALHVEGRLAELEHRNNDAARAYLDVIRLANEATRGGVLIDVLVRIACEANGSTGLQTLLAQLDAGECREVINALESIEKKKESVAEMMKHESEWARRSFPFYQRIVGSLMRLLHLDSMNQYEQKAVLKFQTQDQRRRALLIGVATHAYELEKGQRPKSIAELVPDYLKSIPKDPLTGTNMIYKP